MIFSLIDDSVIEYIFYSIIIAKVGAGKRERNG